MKVFVAEFFSGGGVVTCGRRSIAAQLRQEGWAMLQAVAADASALADVVVAFDQLAVEDLALDGPVASNPVDSDSAASNLAASKPGISNPARGEAAIGDGQLGRGQSNQGNGSIDVHPMDRSAPLWPQWIAAARDCDAAIVIAPESEGLLGQGVAMLRAAGINVIAGSGDFLRTASDKLLTAKALQRAGVAHPLHMAVCDRKHEKALTNRDRFVVKPRDGSGNQKVRVFDRLRDAWAELEENDLLQAWVPGRPVSLSMVATSSQRIFLPAVDQQFHQGTFQYAGGSGPLEDDAQRRLTNLAIRAIEAMPPMARGFIGFDMLLGSRPSQDCVIEINPRVTTSYVGLRQMVRGNLVAKLLEVETEPVSCVASVDSVRWNRRGDVWTCERVRETA